MDTTAPLHSPDGTYDINAIMAVLPHRYPILLIDRVLELVPRERILARKCVTINEGFFQGHFPGYPLMPAVIQVEAIAQAAALLMLIESRRPENAVMLFTGVERARFRRPVVPGDVLEIEVKVLHMRSRAVRVAGIIRVEGKIACEATVTSQLLIRNPEESSETSAKKSQGAKEFTLQDAPVPDESQAVTTE